jgi:hypothetical protein
MKKFPSAAALAVIVACGASTVRAQVEVQPTDGAHMTTDSNSVNPSPVAIAPAGTGGVMVFIDPVTKQMRQPLPGEVEQLLGTPVTPPSKNTSVAQPVMSLVPGGGVSVVLDESTHSYMVVTKKADGTMLMDCLPSAQQATDAVMNGLSTGEILHGKEVHDVH